jgi:predicted adenine nucleotide alpha hydrolase (AANH) superfamily ATPase
MEYIKPEPNTKNYMMMMNKIIESWQKDPDKRGRRPRLLLHSCCAPCSSAVLDQMCRYFDITLFYYNPNISAKTEFEHRASELKRLIHEMGIDKERIGEDGTLLGKVLVVVPEYDHKEFLEIARGHEKDPERGERCHLCYRQRLEKTAAYMDVIRDGSGSCKEADEVPYDYFCTTLTISPMKSAEILNRIGEEVGNDHGEAFLPSDFKKRGGYQKSIELSREYDLYRQDFCGCEFSKAACEKEREERMAFREK